MRYLKRKPKLLYSEVHELRLKLITLSQTAGIVSENSDPKCATLFKHDVDRLTILLKRLLDRIDQRLHDEEWSAITVPDPKTVPVPDIDVHLSS